MLLGSVVEWACLSNGGRAGEPWGRGAVLVGGAVASAGVAVTVAGVTSSAGEHAVASPTSRSAGRTGDLTSS
jgi:hypothetical protein